MCKRTDSNGPVSILQQVDDFLIGTMDKSIAERITERIGERVEFQHEENLPIIFLGHAEDLNGVDIRQFNDSILMSSKGHIEWMLKTHRWDKESPNGPKPCKDGKTKEHPVSPMPADCLTQVCKEEGFKEGTAEHTILEKKMGFQHRAVLGELMHVMATVRSDNAHSITIPSKQSSAPSECHHQPLKGLTKFIQTTKS